MRPAPRRPLGHRWFAAVYDLVNWFGERRLFGPLRARLVGDLGGRLLDLGAGTGATFPYYRSAELVVAADPDPYMLRRAVLLGAGVRPNSALAAGAGLQTGIKGAIGVERRMRGRADRHKQRLAVMCTGAPTGRHVWVSDGGT